mgnify:CR=1 FL=1|tara:strand:- start:586 stop:1314 length:729 start_codon:yes stop_codon:yes gene_type:complete
MVHKSALVETNFLGKNVIIKENVIIRKGAKIGDNVIIHPNVVIESGCEISSGSEIFPGTYIGKIPKGAGATAREISYEEKIFIGENCSIGPNAVIFYDVTIGKNNLIADGASIREKGKIGDFCIIGRYVTLNYNATVGNHSRIMDLTHITGNCTIGNNVFISIHVSTVNDNVVVTREYEEENIIGPIFHDHSTIGAGAIILPGVVIAKNAMVGAGSVVTKDVVENTVVMGIPAKFIKNISKT